MQLDDFENLGHLASFMLQGLAQLRRLCMYGVAQATCAAVFVRLAATVGLSSRNGGPNVRHSSIQTDLQTNAGVRWCNCGALQARAVVEQRLRGPPGAASLPSGSTACAPQLDSGSRQALQSIGLAGAPQLAGGASVPRTHVNALTRPELCHPWITLPVLQHAAGHGSLRGVPLQSCVCP